MFNEDESAAAWYAAHATPGLPDAQTGRVFELMAEVDRGRERSRDETTRRPPTRAEHEQEIAQDEARRDQFLTHCRPTTAAEYTAWLTGYLRAGGEVTHRYNYPMRANWWVLTSHPGYVPTLYGALSVHVIVPADVPFTPRDVPNTYPSGGCGHSSFYFLDGFRRCASGWVPQYDDTAPFTAGEADRG